jgi:hypothetical protein
VGGVGDEGIDGLGLAPISAVLSSRVAVQAKRYDLLRRSAGKLSPCSSATRQRPGRSAPYWSPSPGSLPPPQGRHSHDTDRRPHRRRQLCDLVREQQIGIRIVAQVDEGWFDRFDA